ncbi:hypothetical protein KAX75_02265, partial [candidate division WOR-3 bacterium]|nr:hypothetical protein [candidate division WOR-3 bacterium]
MTNNDFINDDQVKKHKNEFGLVYKSQRTRIEKMCSFHMKGWTNLIEDDPEHGYRVYHQDRRAVKGDRKDSGEKIIIYMLGEHVKKGDIVQWAPRTTLQPEYWKIKKIEDYQPLIVCSVESFSMEDADIVILLRRQNFNEAADFLSNAIELVQGDKPVKFSDCKNNCRKALSSFLRATTGSEDFRKAIKTFIKERNAGGAEGDLFVAFDNLAAKMRDFLAKEGSHPPIAGREEARLAVEVTKAFLRYFVTK